MIFYNVVPSHQIYVSTHLSLVTSRVGTVFYCKISFRVTITNKKKLKEIVKQVEQYFNIIA